MNSQHPSTLRAVRNLRTTTIALFGAIALLTMTGCFGSPRANDTIAGAAIGAGAGALLASGPEGSPATGALIGGLGGGAVGYIVGTETENRWDYGPYGGYGRPYYGGF
jgi:osmotically inducible lipoprotein OsmB